MGVSRCLGCLALRRITLSYPQRQFSPPLLGPNPFIVTSYILGNGGVSKRHYSSSWIPPEGFDTGISIYNFLTKTKVPLRTNYQGLLTWYSCGPTVYDSAHIGHALCYVKQDIIRRILTQVFDLNVIMVMGITDIDDKLIRRSHELKIGFREVAEKYEQEFFKDMDQLRVNRPSIAPRVTHHIPHIIAFTQGIMEQGLAYAVSDGSVYFDTIAYGKYGKFGPLAPLNTLAAAGLKKSQRDFALWKGAKAGEPYWESPWGRGRPGWHIECSAMASHILGTPLDLHSGGIDLAFPHHENEEAQCCAYHSRQQWCNYWLHTGHLHAKGTEKMSKSLYNTISVSALLDQHTVNTFRLFCLLSHYRNKVEYTHTSMLQAQAHLRRVRSFLQDAYAYINGQVKCAPLDEPALKQKLAETRIKVKRSLADDFDTVRAFDAVLDLVNLGNKELHKKSEGTSLSRSAGSMVAICSYIHYLMDDIFGIRLPSVSDASNLSIEGGGKLVEVMDALVKLRGQVRSYALFQDSESAKELQDLSKEEKKVKRQERQPLLAACDELRDDLLKTGLRVKDHKDKSSWSLTDESGG